MSELKANPALSLESELEFWKHGTFNKFPKNHPMFRGKNKRGLDTRPSNAAVRKHIAELQKARAWLEWAKP